jgi:chaperonin cofactor prefoldin
VRAVDMDEKVATLESRVSNLETRVAVAERDIQGINQKLDKIDGNLTRLMWIVIIAVVGALLRLVVAG